MRNIFLIMLISLLLAAGQLCWKYGLTKVGGYSVNAKNVFELVASPFIVIGFVLFGVATLIWLDVISKVEISYAYSLISISYIFVPIGAIFIFKEAIPLIRWVGILVIITGIIIVSKS